jgi:hypothetical protein
VLPIINRNGSVYVQHDSNCCNYVPTRRRAVDVSPYVEPSATWLELRVTLKPATGMLVIYSPGYEEQQAQFTDPESSAMLPFAEPILCVKAVGGPFDFHIEVMPLEGVE